MAPEAADGDPDADRVYEMTGQTGSLCYMAPEVLLGCFYNQKARWAAAAQRSEFSLGRGQGVELDLGSRQHYNFGIASCYINGCDGMLPLQSMLRPYSPTGAGNPEHPSPQWSSWVER